MTDKAPKFEWRPDFPIYDEINLQDVDQVEAQTPNAIGPADPLEEFSDEEDWSMDWADPNDRGFESDNYNENDQDRRLMTADDPNSRRLDTNTWAALHLESYDADDIFAQARATAANAETSNNVQMDDDNDNDQQVDNEEVAITNDAVELESEQMETNNTTDENEQMETSDTNDQDIDTPKIDEAELINSGIEEMKSGDVVEWKKWNTWSQLKQQMHLVTI